VSPPLASTPRPVDGLTIVPAGGGGGGRPLPAVPSRGGPTARRAAVSPIGDRRRGEGGSRAAAWGDPTPWLLPGAGAQGGARQPAADDDHLIVPLRRWGGRLIDAELTFDALLGFGQGTRVAGAASGRGLRASRSGPHSATSSSTGGGAPAPGSADRRALLGPDGPGV